MESSFLTPREVAELFGVRTTTIARWAREGRLEASLTPGGHRRYRIEDVRALLQKLAAITPLGPEQEQLEVDAVRLYDQGWSIRQVADKFDYSYGAMRRLLRRRTTLRTRSASEDQSWPGGLG